MKTEMAMLNLTQGWQKPPDGKGNPSEMWWRGAVIYQIYPRSFCDSDGDGVGDLRGITEKMDYIAHLGVDAVWLAPFFPSPMKDFGYDIADYRGVDPLFGSLEDFKALLETAHRRGIRIIIDQVLSHTSDRHRWFQESARSRTGAKADWYVWSDAKEDGTPPNNWLSIFGGSAWEWCALREQYYLHNFLAEQPDLNFHCDAVQDALLQEVRFWLDLGVDGLRLDTVNFYFCDAKLRDNPPATDLQTCEAPSGNPYSMQNHLYSKSRPENIAFLKKLRCLLDLYPGSTTVGEVGAGSRSLEVMSAYTKGGDRLHMCYTFDLLGKTFTPLYFKDRIEQFESVVGDGWACWSFSNHDVMRHLSRWCCHDQKREAFARLTASLLLTLRGSACLYQGEELGYGEAELTYEDLTDPYGIRFWPYFKGRDGCRTPMVWDGTDPGGGFTSGQHSWLPIAKEHRDLSATRQIDRSDSTYHIYRTIIAFRKKHRAMVDGTITVCHADEKILLLARANTEETVVAAFNMSNSPASVTKDLIAPLGTVTSMTDRCHRQGDTLHLESYGVWFGHILQTGSA